MSMEQITYRDSVIAALRKHDDLEFVISLLKIIANDNPENVKKYLDQFISAAEEVFETK